MAHPAEDLCCEISQGISASGNCQKRLGGITDVRIACLKYLDTITVNAENAATDPGVITAIGAADPVTAAAATPYYKVSVRSKTAGHAWDYTYDEDSGGIQYDENVNFEITAYDDTTMVSIREMLGQEVAILFKLRGQSDEFWYSAGHLGGLRVTQITGGTGTDSAVQTAFAITGTDISDTFRRVDDAVDPLVLVDALTN